MIPKIIHYVWVGPRPFPADAQLRVDQWRSRLPDYELRLWNEHNIDFTPLFVCQAYGVGAYNRVANYARMAALERFGGIYLDHDIEVLQSFDPLLGDGFFAGFQTKDPTAKDIVNNAVIGAEPGHPITRSVLAALDAMSGAAEVGSGTGPGMLSKVLRARGDPTPQAEPTICGGAKLYPPRYFYPYEWTEEFDPSCVTPDTVAIHYWAATWKQRPSRLEALRKKLQRALTAVNPRAAAMQARARNLRLRAKHTALIDAAEGYNSASIAR